MKTYAFIILMLALSCLNDAMGQWTTVGNNIYNSNTGNVGIGNSTPTALLHVAKIMTEPTIAVQNLGGSGGATYSMIDNNSGAFWKFKATNTGGFKVRDQANALDVFVIEPNSAANALYINGAGYLGLGTAVPGAKLDVAGHIWQTSTGHSVFLGEYAGSGDDLSDNRNVFIGYQAGYSNSSGENNTAIGYFTLLTNTTGSNNTANGYYSLYLNTGDGNTANGYAALMVNTSGSYNTANGYSTLGANSSGSYNTANGLQSMFSNSSGDNNTANGSHSLYTNTTGYSNTALGYYADVAEGDLNNATAIGSNAMVATSNSLVLGSIAGINGATESVNVGIGTTAPEASALLDVSSTTRGFLPPRMTQVQILEIASPASGLIVFCTTDEKFYAYIAGANAWKELSFGSGVITQPAACGDPLIINHVAGAIAPVSKTVNYGTVTAIPGEPSKCWITSNLGADHQASAVNDATEASAGWYWQFNRMQGYKHDGTTRTPNTTWITSIDENSDWLTANDPCFLELGNGWRLPTRTEWSNVDAAGGWNDWIGPWNSALKLHVAGSLTSALGSLINRGYFGYYTSISQNNNTLMWYLYIQYPSSPCFINVEDKEQALSARCIRN